ncbi:ABC transporter substrate-binding protein [Azospirillum sp.]|uniref:ABC transporter substrate-binding protein n=1 Tax=Azospirillum sp. TaxID=34012 RepID=UPI003D743ACB
MRNTLIGAAAGLAALAALPAMAQTVPEGYPASYKDTIAAANKEGKVVVYSSTDAAQVRPLLDDFKALYPNVTVEYNDLNSTELYNRFISEAAAGAGSGDVLWSSAMDLQIKLVNDGYAQAYQSPELKALPQWSVWKNEAFGTTFEPVIVVYNKRLVPAGDVPKTHADLAKLLEAKGAEYKGKVTAYDPERSGVGYLFVTQDAAVWPGARDLFRAFGKAGIKLYTSAGAMLERVTSGEHLIGYNIFGSYALTRSKKDPNIGIVYPEDYTLVMSRVAFIPKAAKNPNAAKLFLDYVLSKRGQTLVANQAELFSIRDDVEGEATAKAVNAKLGDKVKPIKVGPELLSTLDQTKRLAFIKQWQQAMQGK